MKYFTEDAKLKELRDIYESMESKPNEQIEIFNRFSPDGNAGFLAKWGSSEQEEYKHLGQLEQWHFNPEDNVFKIITKTVPLVSEDLFHKIANEKEQEIHEILIDSEYADYEDLFIDSVVANRLKKKGYAGVIYTFAMNSKKKNAMDIRGYDQNIDRVYNGFMTMNPQFLKTLN